MSGTIRFLCLAVEKRLRTDFTSCNYLSGGIIMRQTLSSMKEKIFFSIRAGTFALLLFSAATPTVAAQTRELIEVKSLSLGLVSETHQQEIENHFRDFVRYVARKLSSGPEIEARIVVASTPFAIAKLLEQRKVDFYMESAYPTYVINFVHGAGRLLLRRWKSGLADYYSVIFTRTGGGVKRLDDLKGKTIVFEDPGSTSGYLMPKLFLQRQGLKLIEKGRYNPDAVSTDVGYVFARSQDKLVEAVLSGQAAAGAFSNDDFSALDEKKKTDIAPLAQTDRLPRHLLSVRADLAPALVDRLEKILLAMDEDAEGRKILLKTDSTTKFDVLPGGEAAMRRRLLDSFYSPGNK
jgi:phosphate/phosphite/phosphonate ABC transporter binding protein